MNPMRGVFGILFRSMHADCQHYLFTFVRTDINRILKRNRFPLWAVKYECFVPQGFQLGLYSFNVAIHRKNCYATGVGLSRTVMNVRSSLRSTSSSPLYLPLSPCNM